MGHTKNFLLADFEYRHTPGNKPIPVCFVAFDYQAEREIRVWLNDSGGCSEPPIDLQNYTLVAYYALAELSCFQKLNWPMPKEVLDLYVEFKCNVNGTSYDKQLSLLDCLNFLGIAGIEADEKHSMRNLILGKENYNEEEKQQILDYCASDVMALRKIVGKINYV